MSSVSLTLLSVPACTPATESAASVRPAAAVLCVFAAVMPLFYAAPLFDPYLAAKQLLLTAGAALLVLLQAVSTRDIPMTSLWKPIAAMALLGAISLVEVTRPDTAIMLASALAVFAVTLSEMRDANRRDQLTGLLVAAGTLEAVYVLWQALASDPLLPTADLPGKWRAFGTFGNPNWAGEFLAAAILVTAGRLMARFSRAGAAALAVMTAALGATFARGAWLACIVGIAALAVCRRQAWTAPLRKTWIAATGIATALIATLAFTPEVQRYLLNLDSIRGRIWIWLVSLRMIADAPLGAGIGNFGKRFPEAQARLFQSTWAHGFIGNASFTPRAHNDYLQFIVETGVFAIPAIAALLWMIARRGRRLSADSIALGLWAAALSLLVNGFFASPLYLPGSLALAAILLGAAEASIATFRPIRARWSVIAATLAAVFALGAWTWCRDRGVAQYRVQKASAILPLQQWNRAAAQLEIARQHDPGWGDVYVLLGRAKLAQRQFTVAADIYRRADSLTPNVEALAGEATALWHAGRGAEAIAVMERLVRLRPDQQTYRARLERLTKEAAE